MNQPCAFSPVALDVDVHPRLEAAARVGQEHDVGLEPLGLVQVHQPDDVGAAGLERQRLDLVRRLAVGLERVGGIGEAAAILDDLAHAVDGVQEVARLDAAGRRRRQREVAGVLEDAVERGAGREHARPAVVLLQRASAARRGPRPRSASDSAERAPGSASGSVAPCEDAEPAAGLLEGEQLADR